MDLDPQRARGQSKTNREWLSIQEASSLIGVSPATLRRWSDAGEIRAFTTPGGHRRFARAAVLALLPAARRQRPSLERLGETPEHMVSVYHRQLGKTIAGTPWLGEIDDSERGPFRDHGRRIAGALLAFIDAETAEARARALLTGSAAAAEYGRIAAMRGIGLAETVDVFLRFRLPLLNELASVAERRSLETTEATALLMSAIEAIDSLVSALMERHDEATAMARAAASHPDSAEVLQPVDSADSVESVDLVGAIEPADPVESVDPIDSPTLVTLPIEPGEVARE